MTKTGGIGPVPIDAGNVTTGHVIVVRANKLSRAVFTSYDKEDGEFQRSFGTGRPTVEESVKQLAHSKLTMMPEPELKRLVAKMQELTPYRCNADDIRQDKVKVFHQIYGVFCDGKPMSQLFQNSQNAWMGVAEENDGIYHCWHPSGLETIIQACFPRLWPLYSDQLRFLHIQRVDIGRICILILCGGMYIDLDVMPNREVYYQVPFAVCRIDRTELMEGKRETRRIGTTATSIKTAKSIKSMRTKTTPYEKKRRTKHRYDLWYEMEAIIADPRNPVLTRWLMFVVEKVKCEKV